MGKLATTALLIEHQIEAIKAVYHGTVDSRTIASAYPSLSRTKSKIFSVARALPLGMADKSLHRAVLKALKMPVPDRCYTDTEMRDAIVAYHLKSVVKRTIPSITDEFGPSGPTLWRQHKRLVAALEMAGVSKQPADVFPDDVRRVAAAIDFPTGGRPTLFLPDEERLLLEMAAQHADHGHGKGKRLQLNYAKRAISHMAKEETDPALKEKLANAKLSRAWLGDVRERVAKMDGDGYTDKKPATLSQTRAAAKKPGQNAAMFAQQQAKYDELGAAGKLPGCQREDGHYEPPPHLIYAGDEMGIEPNGKRWTRVLARKGSGLVHRIVTGEHNPFWVTLFFWCRVDGNLDIPPCVVHKAAQMRGDLAHGLPMQPGKQWLVRASESGYLTKDDWFLVCAHLKMHILHRPAFVQFDGFVNHWDPDALALLVEDDIYVFFLKSQDSDSDQLNDNGPNASVKAGYSRGYDDWLECNPGVPYTPFYLNPILAAAWAEFVEKGRPIIIRAAKKCGISPFNPNAENFQGSAVSEAYDLVAADKKAESPPSPPEVERTETTSKMTVLQLKAANPDGTLVIRSSAASFFETSFVKPAQELQRELKLQRDLKKQTASLEVDRAIPETSVGRWVTAPLLASLKANCDAKQLALQAKEARQVENASKKAQAHVKLLDIGSAALDKLRADANAKLKLPELQGAITKFGAKPKGKAADLKAQLERLIAKKGLPALLPPPATPAAASPLPLLALPSQSPDAPAADVPLANRRPRRGSA